MSIPSLLLAAALAADPVEVATINTEADTVSEVVYSHDGSAMYCVLRRGYESSIVRFDLSTGNEEWRHSDEAGTFGAIAVDLRNEFVAVVRRKHRTLGHGPIEIRASGTGAVVSEVAAPPDDLEAARHLWFVDAGRGVVGVGTLGDVVHVDWRSGKLRKIGFEFAEGEGGSVVHKCALSRELDVIAVGATSGFIRFVPFGDREFAPSIGKPGYVVPLSLAGFPISAVAFAEDRSEFLMVARWPRQDRGEQRSLWAYHELIRFKIDGRSVVEEERVELPFQVARMHYMDDQDAVVLVTGERRPKICVWSLKSMSLLGSLRLEECSLTSVAYNSAVNEIAIGTREGQIVRIGLAVEE